MTDILHVVRFIAFLIGVTLLTYGNVQMARVIIADVKRSVLADEPVNSDAVVFAQAIAIGVGLALFVYACQA